MPSVPESLRVTRDDLRRWAGSAGSAEALPRLVRSLIAETEPSAEWIDMPAGTAVASSGWDGVVRCAHGNRFVPAGLSVWELSTKQNDSHGKARPRLRQARREDTVCRAHRHGLRGGGVRPLDQGPALRAGTVE